jgi:cholesterol transport system auxiliary component
MIRAALRLAVMGACALALSGCISLLPKSKPAQLYRFGQPMAAAAAQSTSAATVGVFQANGAFQGEAAGDRILTVSGGKAAFIAQSRWVAPAGVLFNEAVVSAFDADGGRVRLISRGQQGKSAYALRLDVRNFEARYDSGPQSAPTVVVRVRAVLTSADLSKTAEQIFESRTKAANNRVGAIVEAYDKATSEVLGQVVGWTNTNAS